MLLEPSWAVIVALPHEAKALLPELKVHAQTTYHAGKLYEGEYRKRPVLLLQTGMGSANATRAVEFLLEHHPVHRCLITGYCGGLVPGLKTGHGVLATRLLSQADEKSILQPEFPQLDSLRTGLKSQGLEVQEGSLVEVARPVLELKDKQSLQQTSGAIAVDMESFSVLKALKADEKIASLILRFVVDPLEENLADTEAFIDDQCGVRPWKLLQETFRNPKLLIDLPQLDRLARQARRQMKKALDYLLNLDPGDGA